MDNEELKKIIPFDLPEWFSLCNYNDTSEYSIHDWSPALELRSSAAYLLEYIESKLEYRERIENHFWNCLEKASKKIHSNTTSFSRLTEKYEGWELKCRTVSPIHIGLLAALWSGSLDDKKISSFSDNLLEGQYPKDQTEREKYEKIEATHIDFLYDKSGQEYIDYTGGYAHLSVDLEAPEEILVEHFKETIRDYKRILKLPSLPKKITKKDFINWADKRVLLYIDLTLLAKYHKKRISHQTMGVILFPDDYYVSLDDRIRRTIKPLADKLLSQNFIAAIRAQADSTQEKRQKTT